MIDVFWSIFGFIIAVSILVTFHEFGHFIVARSLGVKVLRFSVGFGKTLWKTTDKKGTEYVIAIIPLGGYVKMLDETETEVAERDLPYSFNRKSVWQRTLIVAAGPAFNFIFAIFAYWIFFLVGTTTFQPILGAVQPHTIAGKAGLRNGNRILTIDHQTVQNWLDVNLLLVPKIGETTSLPLTYNSIDDSTIKTTTLNLQYWKVNQSEPDLLGSLGFVPYIPAIPAVVAKVFPGSPAAKAGLLPNDKIISIDGLSINTWDQMTAVFNKNINKSMSIEVLHNGKIQKLVLTPEAVKSPSGLLQAKVGIESIAINWPKNLLTTIKYPFFGAGLHALATTWQMTKITLQTIYKLIIGKISIRSISGPIGIAESAGVTAQQGFSSYLSFLGLISISLAVINILPIPMLDGGHLLYFAIEIIRGKPLSLEAQLTGIRLGLTLLLCLMFIAVYNDIARLLN